MSKSRKYVQWYGPKATSTLDVEVLLSEAVGDVKTLTRYVEIFREKNKHNALVHPKKFIPTIIWHQIHKKVKALGGSWKSKERMWVVPLAKGRSS